MTSTGRTLSCPTCRTPVVPGARFCHACGVPLEGPTALAGGAERRVVTVLFGDLSDFTAWAEDLDPERVGEVVDRVLAGLADVVRSVGGHVDKLTGDGIMAVFGAPTAHEDDPARAVRAAAAMQDEVRRLVADETGGGSRLALRVGLNTGVVLAGVQAALSYTVVGDTVNTAARLSDAAGIGAVLAGRDTALATMAEASWRPLTPLRLKGKREPVPAYELVGLRPASDGRLGLGEESVLVGRDAELGALIGAVLDVTTAGAPDTVLMTGEAGAGKTRLVAELVRFTAELPGSRVLRTRAAPYGVARALAPLAELVRTACSVPDGADPQQAAARVRRAVTRLAHPSRGALVPNALTEGLLTLIGVPPLHATALPADMALIGDVSAGAALVDSVSHLLQSLIDGGPLLLVLDDAHWAPPELLEILAGLVDRLRGPVLLVLAGRDGLSAPPALRIGRHVTLAPLDEQAAASLLRAYLAGAELPPEAGRELLARTRGNPYFLAELLHLLVDRGVLLQGERGWEVNGPLPAGMLPAGVHAVLAARIDELPGTTRAVLRAAAVLGTRFPAGALPAVERRSRRDVAAALDELVARQLIRSPEPGEVLHAFAHPMTRDVAYAALPRSERARRHARAAAWAAEHVRGEVRAGQPARPPLPAPDELRALAADQAEEAVTLARSMALDPAHPAWSTVRLGLEALLELGRQALDRRDHLAALALLDRGRALAGSVAGSPDGQLRTALAEIGLLQARALAAQQRLDEARDALAPTLDAPGPGLRAAGLQMLAEIRHRQGSDGAAGDLLARAAQLAAESGDEPLIGAVLRSLGMQDYYAGRLGAAQDRFRASLQLGQRAGDRRGEAWSLQHLGWNAVSRGDYATAEETLAAAAGIFGTLDDTVGMAWCAGTRALLLLLSGRLRATRDRAAELLPVAEALGERYGRAACLLLDAVAAAELGAVEVATSGALLAREGFAQIGDSWGVSVARLAEGLAARAAGDSGTALRAMRTAIDEAQRGGHPLTRILALLGYGLVALEAGAVAEAGPAAAQAERELAGLEAQPRLRAGLDLLQAQLALADGRPDDAVALLDGCLLADDGQPSLICSRRLVLAQLSAAHLAAGRPSEAARAARLAGAEPAEDVRSALAAERALQAVGEALPAARAAGSAGPAGQPVGIEQDHGP